MSQTALPTISLKAECPFLLAAKIMSAWFELEGHALKKVMPNSRISMSISQEVAKATMETAASKISTGIVVGPDFRDTLVE